MTRRKPPQLKIVPETPLEPPEYPEPFPFLSAHAAEEWRRLAPDLSKNGTLTALGFGPFAAYCEAYSTWRSATETMAALAARDALTHGLLVQNGEGALVVNPLVEIVRAAGDAMLLAAHEFGLTPR
jgi:P27 family predicted phage terminase small subunit